MNQDREININWLRFNVPQIVAVITSVLVSAIGIAMYVQSLASDVRKIEENRAMSRALLDKDIDVLKSQFDKVSSAPLRLDILERGLASTNQRMDTYLTTLGTKIDGVSDKVNGLTTKVEVLSNKIDIITPNEKPSQNQGQTQYQ